MEIQSASLNAKVAGVLLAAGATVLHFVNQLEPSLLPIRLLVIGILIMGAWAFSDEMGLRKPLNRAAFICFVFAMLALACSILVPENAQTPQYFLIYSFCLLFSVLIWSGAFLHRQKSLKIAGAVGAVASLLPLLALIVGHISIGAGAFLGVSALLSPAAGQAVITSVPVRSIEAVFVVWSIITAVFLWKGGMTSEPS